MNDLKKFGIFSSLLIIFLASVVLAQESLPGDWKGYVYINNSIASDGTPVSAVIGTSWVANTTVGAVEAGTGYYLIHVPGETGNKVKFKVCGVNATLDEQDWSVGPHPNATTGSPYINLSITTLADGASCSYSCACSGGYCCSGATEYTAGEGTGTCQSSACTVTTTTVAAGVGPGAAATTTTLPSVTTTTLPVVKEMKSITRIEANSSGTLNYTTVPITQIEVNVKNTVISVQIEVTEQSTQPATISIGAPGVTYSYLTVTKTGITDEDVSSVKIKFKVEKSWIAANNIEPSTITLNRYVNGAWVALPTVQLSEDANYIYFEATSPGLSIFVVTAQKKAVTTTTLPTTTTTLPPPPSDWWWIAGIVIVVLMAAFLYFFFVSKKVK